MSYEWNFIWNFKSSCGIDDYSCRVTVDSDQRIINKTFKVIATDDSGNKGEVEIEISGGVW